MQQKWELARMTWVEVKEASADKRVVLIPVGAVEQHGPQTPMGADNFVAAYFAEEVARATGSVVAPAIPFGCSQFFGRFPGTVTIRPEHLHAYVTDVVESMVRHGFDHIVIVDNHGGNGAVIDQVAWDAREALGIVIARVFPYAIGKELGKDLYPDGETTWGHGTEPVLSLMTALTPDDVRMDLAVVDGWSKYQGQTTIGGPKIKIGKGTAHVYFDQADVSETGARGDPTKADGDRGRTYLRRMADFGIEFVKAFQAMDTRVDDDVAVQRA